MSTGSTTVTASFGSEAIRQMPRHRRRIRTMHNDGGGLLSLLALCAYCGSWLLDGGGGGVGAMAINGYVYGVDGNKAFGMINSIARRLEQKRIVAREQITIL